MAEERVRYEIREGVAFLGMDDGKANALSHEMIAELESALERAGGEAQAVVLSGRPGRFCAGFDLTVMRSTPEAMAALVRSGADLYARMLTHPQPIVVAATGHALAAGALALLAADYRIGARGDFKIGLNEVAIGLTLPRFAVEMARERLSKRHFHRAAAQAEIYTPDGARDAGFLDEVVEPEGLAQAVATAAARLAAHPGAAFEATKARTVGALAERVLETAAAEMPLGSEAT
jgi:enoyl-CoA hydratase